MVDKYIEDMNIEEKVSILIDYCLATRCELCAFQKEALGMNTGMCTEYVDICLSESEWKLNRALLLIGVCSNLAQINAKEAGDFLWE